MKWESAHFSTIFTVWHRWQSQLNKISLTRKKIQSYLSLPGVSERFGKCLFFPPSVQEASCYFTVLKPEFLLLAAQKFVLVPMLKTYANHNNHQMNSTFTPMVSQLSFSCLLGIVLFCWFLKISWVRNLLTQGYSRLENREREIKTKPHQAEGYWKDDKIFKNKLLSYLDFKNYHC